jgi:hypothetical protein
MGLVGRTFEAGISEWSVRPVVDGVLNTVKVMGNIGRLMGLVGGTF